MSTNQSYLTHSRISQEWKTRLIIQIPNNGDPTNLANYKPIALLCAISKVFEKLMFNHISDFIYPFLSPYQFGFIPGWSCL